jgi:hypothetical protein
VLSGLNGCTQGGGRAVEAGARMAWRRPDDCQH